MNRSTCVIRFTIALRRVLFLFRGFENRHAITEEFTLIVYLLLGTAVSNALILGFTMVKNALLFDKIAMQRELAIKVSRTIQ